MLEADESCTLDIVKVNDVTQVMSASLEYGQFWGGGAKPCFKICVSQVNKPGLQPVSKTCGTNSWVLSKRFKCEKVFKKCLKSYRPL